MVVAQEIDGHDRFSCFRSGSDDRGVICSPRLGFRGLQHCARLRAEVGSAAADDRGDCSPETAVYCAEDGQRGLRCGSDAAHVGSAGQRVTADRIRMLPNRGSLTSLEQFLLSENTPPPLEVPEQSFREQFASALGSLMPALYACARGQVGIAGTTILLRSDGSVASVNVGGGGFGGTPAGRCMEGVIRGGRFPTFRQSTRRVSYPIRFRSPDEFRQMQTRSAQQAALRQAEVGRQEAARARCPLDPECVARAQEAAEVEFRRAQAAALAQRAAEERRTQLDAARSACERNCGPGHPYYIAVYTSCMRRSGMDSVCANNARIMCANNTCR